eukprot:TRINITY_DN3934_c0_g1_i2.p1 TRINITY_DN3934_c0_g1~~TRINITY_DN3934_c0_g1_i2.p1  ORF type:complete len:345 (+),score=48.02 TRINITY_DN3934_c0_g1_i2:86-1120(+)
MSHHQSLIISDDIDLPNPMVVNPGVSICLSTPTIALPLPQPLSPTISVSSKKTPGIGLLADVASAPSSTDAVVSSSPLSLENSTFKVGDEVEVFTGKRWLSGKLVLVSKRSIIAEYQIAGKTFQKLLRSLENLAEKGTHLDWAESVLSTESISSISSASSPETFPTSPLTSSQFPSAIIGQSQSPMFGAFGSLAMGHNTTGLKVNPQEHLHLRQQAEKQRVANQELVRKNLKLREDFDRLCQEFGELKMQFDTSVETREQHATRLFTSDSEGICPHFLKGKCRFKDKCRSSHDISYCVYCQAKLPSNKVASSAHLSKCYRRMQSWQDESNSESTSTGSGNMTSS